MKRAVTVLQNVGIEATEKKMTKGKTWMISPIADGSPNDDDVNDDVNDDVANDDDVKATSSFTSSYREALSHRGAPPKPSSNDDDGDAQQCFSVPVSRSHFREENRETEKQATKDNSGFTSSTSSFAPENRLSAQCLGSPVLEYGND